MFKVIKHIAEWLLGGQGSLDRLADAMATGGENN